MTDSVTPQGWTWRSPQGWTWDHHAIADQRDRTRLLADEAIPAFARAVLTGSDETPHLEARAEAVAGITHDFASEADSDTAELAAVRFAVLPDRLVTARRSPVASLWQAFNAARGGAAPDSPAAMLDRIIERFAATVLDRTARQEAVLDGVEDALLDGRSRVDRVALGRVRQSATRLQRAVAPLARMVLREADTLPAWFADAEQEAGATARRRLLAAQDALAALQARARALQEELSAQQVEETNRRLYVLSVVTVMIMPPTLVTGFYGMNTGGLPFEKPDWGTLAAAGTVCLAALAALLLLRRFRLL